MSGSTYPPRPYGRPGAKRNPYAQQLAAEASAALQLHPDAADTIPDGLAAAAAADVAQVKREVRRDLARLDNFLRGWSNDPSTPRRAEGDIKIIAVANSVAFG